MLTLRQIIREGFEPPMLIFVQSKDRAKELYHELTCEGVNANVIHADRKKQDRDEVMKDFRLGKIWVLICTDLMSRGVDFKTVNVVVNYDFPQSVVSYIHRVGRTGRAGRKGRAITFFTDEDAEFLRNIGNLMKKSSVEGVADWMLKLKAASSKRWKELEKRPLKRKTISTEVGRNTNKRFQKIIEKDAKRLRKIGAKEGWQQLGNAESGEKPGEVEEEGWQMDDDEALQDGEQFASDDEEINSDEC